MTLRFGVILLVANVVALSSVWKAVSAQALSVSAVVSKSNHELLSDRLVGSGIGAAFPIGGRLSARIGAERMSGQAHRIGVPCAGLIQPDTCAPEPVQDDARLTVASGGLALRVLSWGRIGVDLTADLHLGWINVDTRGRTSNRALSADKQFGGGDLGVDAVWFPSARLPLALEVGASAGGLTPLHREQVVDGYTPFESAIDLTRFRFGVAWRRR